MNPEVKKTLVSRRDFLRFGGVLLASEIFLNSCSSANPAVPMPALIPEIQPALPVDSAPVLRGAERAIASAEVRLKQAVEFPESDLERMLKTGLNESSIGLVNGHFYEGRDGSRFNFPVNPHLDVSMVDGEIVPLLVNNQKILDFYGEDKLIRGREMYDRSCWSMQRSRSGAAIIETDYLGMDPWFGEEELKKTVNLLAGAGVKIIPVGNEPNDPYTPWRNSLPKIYHDTQLVWETVAKLGQRPEIFLPGLAYWGDESYLKAMLLYFRQRQTGSKNLAYPFDGVADHFYGPVDDVIPRISLMRKTIDQAGFKNLPYILTEVGDPGVNTPEFQVSDRQRAEEYIPQVLSLIASSDVVRESFWHAFYTGTNDYASLTEFKNGRFEPKDSYRAYSNVTRLMSRTEQIEHFEKDNVTFVKGERNDGIKFLIIWSNEETEKSIIKPKNYKAYDTLGRDLEKDGDITKIDLKPRSQIHLAGQAIFLVSQAA